MVNIDRAVVTWSGFVGGPGISVFYAIPGGAVAPKLRTFFNDIKAVIPQIITIQVPTEGDTIEAETGTIVGSWTGASSLPVSGSGVGDYGAAGGALIRWVTGGIVAGRRVRGRTFVVPVISSIYGPDGQLDASALTILSTGAQTLVLGATPNLVIWSRPNASRAGSAHPVTTHVEPKKMSVLRSRRD